MKIDVDGICEVLSNARMLGYRDDVRELDADWHRLVGENMRLNAEVERLTRERDEALEKARRFEAQCQADVLAVSGPLMWSVAVPLNLPPPQRAVAELVHRAEHRMQPPAYEPVGEKEVRLIPATHAEKALVDVAKAAARLGAEEMRKRVVKMLKTSAQAYGSASTACRDYARDAALDYVSRIEGWTL